VDRFPRAIALLAAVIAAACGGRTSPRRPAAPSLGRVHLRVSCDATVQADFDRALALLHHMTYPQARAGFQAVLARDARCAMAHWGIAMTLFQPLWPTRPGPAELAAGWQAAERARALAPASALERGHIAAVAAFFRDPADGDYWRRVDRWEAALAALHEEAPDDPEVTAFYALALLASARPGSSVDQHARAALALLVPLLRQHPDHPGAMHYIVHADDTPGRERDNLDIVRRYERAAPDNPHAQHMPTHIYTRLGDWDGVIRGNLRARASALRYPAGDRGQLVWDEFAHATEYLVYAYLQEGADGKAAAAIERLLATKNIEPTAKTAFHLASTQARYALERQDWHRAAAIVPREPPLVDRDRFPGPEAVAWFARGYGARRAGGGEEPARAIARLAELEKRTTDAGEVVFARQIQVLRLDLEAWVRHAAKDDVQATALLQQAVELEGATPKPPVTPAPTLPAPELLGDLLLELGRAGEAADAYRLSLERFPRRFNSTLGLARALEAAGDRRAAASAYCDLIAIAARGTRARSLAELRPHRASCRAPSRR
jgi:tetratricopeptide (TPR) repeat protein